jgi:hypothetical protein
MIEIIFCLGIRNNYELLQNDSMLNRYTLMNTGHTINENQFNTLQETDGTEFVTAYEQLDTMGNKPVELDDIIDDSQVTPKQTDVLYEKVSER